MLLVGTALSVAGILAAFAHPRPAGRRLPIGLLTVGAVLLVLRTAASPAVTGALLLATLAPLLGTGWWLIGRLQRDGGPDSLDAPPR